MSKIVIMESLGISAEELAARKAPFEAQGHVFVDYSKTTDPAKLIEEAKDADAMILANMPMPADVLRKCDKLKFIDVAFTGVDHVGLDAAKEKNIASAMLPVTPTRQFPSWSSARLFLLPGISAVWKTAAVKERTRPVLSAGRSRAKRSVLSVLARSAPGLPSCFTHLVLLFWRRAVRTMTALQNTSSRSRRKNCFAARTSWFCIAR